MSTHTYRAISYMEICRYHKEEVNTNAAFRVYKYSSARVTVQLRGLLLDKNYKPTKYGVLACAILNKTELTELRDAINTSLEELS